MARIVNRISSDLGCKYDNITNSQEETIKDETPMEREAKNPTLPKKDAPVHGKQTHGTYEDRKQTLIVRQNSWAHAVQIVTAKKDELKSSQEIFMRAAELAHNIEQDILRS